MTLIADSDPRPVHFVGIAGAGMRALAELLARRGVPVTGCDANPGWTGDLEALGIAVAKGHDPEHVVGAREVIVTSAMSKNHPELLRARELGIPITRRAEALGQAVAGGRLIAIAGTHGKTTTTVMTTATLAAAGLKPTGIAGGRVAEWRGNLHYESDELFVVEADEYDRSFLSLSPNVAVVTNVEADHLDIYRDLEDIRATFSRFVRGAAAIVLCDDDAGARSIDLPASAEVIRYGIKSRDARLVASDVRSIGQATTFRSATTEIPSAMSLSAFRGCTTCKTRWLRSAPDCPSGSHSTQMRPGLLEFGGVDRRFQRLCDVVGVTIIDDYAHHPTEIVATLQAARASYPGRRVVAAFQPHLFTRTRDFSDAFGKALSGADCVFLAEIYPAREQPIDGVTSELVAISTKRSGRVVTWQGPRSELADALARFVIDGDVVITIGAGDITRTGLELKTRLETRST